MMGKDGKDQKDSESSKEPKMTYQKQNSGLKITEPFDLKKKEKLLEEGVAVQSGRFLFKPLQTSQHKSIAAQSEEKKNTMTYKKSTFTITEPFDPEKKGKLLEKGVTLGLGRFKVTKPPRKESTGTPSKEATRKDTEGKESFTAAEKKLLESGKDITKGRFTIRAIPPEVQNPQITENKEERTPSPNEVARSFSEPSSPKVTKQESPKSSITDDDIMKLINERKGFAAPITTKADNKKAVAEILDIFDKTPPASSRNVDIPRGGVNNSKNGGFNIRG